MAAMLPSMDPPPESLRMGAGADPAKKLTRRLVSGIVKEGNGGFCPIADKKMYESHHYETAEEARARAEEARASRDVHHHHHLIDEALRKV